MKINLLTDSVETERVGAPRDSREADQPSVEEIERESEHALETKPSSTPFTEFEKDDFGRPRAKRNMLYVLLFPLIVLVAVLVYVFGFRQKGEKPPFPPVESSEVVDSSKVQKPSAEETAPTVPLSPLDKDVLASVQTGVSSITAVTESLPSGCVISMLTYHGDRSMTMQVSSATKATLDGYFQTLQNDFPTAKIDKAGEDSHFIRGRTFQRLTVSIVGLEETKPTASGNVQQLDFEQFKEKMNQLATDTDVSVQSITGGTRSFTSGDVVRTPVSVRLIGKPDAGLRFLKEIASAQLNIKFSKIIYLSSNRADPLKGDVDLILHMDLVKPSP